MILCIVDPSVIGIYDPFRASALLPEGIYVALPVISVRKDSFIIAEMTAADTFSGRVGFQ